jgi:hypothetical protein
MELRTTFNIEPSPYKISYTDKVMFIGSCFASNMGSQMAAGHMPVMINPFGTVFNPVSISNTLDAIIQGKKFMLEDLHFHDGTWLSFYHYTDFSAGDPAKVLDKINTRTAEASAFLKSAKYLFITFGTARVYALKKTNQIVSNCHKIPADKFNNKILSVDEISDLWKKQLDNLQTHFPQLRIVFTISPVRHWKDGAHGNQLSKSILFVAVEELLKHRMSPDYFPAYEIMMDDLRDYRYYNDDMLHISPLALNYIWDAFAGCYLDFRTLNIWKNAIKVARAFNHRINTDSDSGKKTFAEKVLRQISDIKRQVPEIDFSTEEDYFLKMRSI